MGPTVAVDQGTTSTKGGRLSDGVLELVEPSAHRQVLPRPGWVEHDPEELLRSVRAVLDAAVGLGPVDAVGIANQGETVVAWDARTGRPVHHAIVWQDDRTRERIETLRAEGAEELTLERAGLPLDPYFSASKLGWMAAHIPECRELLATGRLRLGTTDAYFLDRLCGVFVTDLTTASRTSLLDARKGRWDEELCDLFGVPQDALPAVVPTTGTLGEVEVGGRAIQITASIVDQQAALYGHGCRRQGDAKVTFGTGAFVLSVAGEAFPEGTEGRVLPTVAWHLDGREPVYALDGGIYDAGSAVDWARNVGLFASYGDLEAARDRPAIDEGLVFVPALSGLACPYWDRTAAGVWIGMTHATRSEDLSRAVLEGVALQTALVLDEIGGWIGQGSSVSVDGGLAKSEAFCSFLATVLQLEVTVPPVTELTVLGAALLAADGEEETQMWSDARTYEPGEGEPQRWRELFADAVSRARGWRR